MRHRQGAGVEQLGRPAAGLEGAVVGAGLDETDGGAALREAGRDDAAGGPAAEHEHVEALGHGPRIVSRRPCVSWRSFGADTCALCR